jgi:hypothetical protein
VLTTVWRGYSPLAGSTGHYSLKTRRSKASSGLSGHVSVTASVPEQPRICKFSDDPIGQAYSASVAIVAADSD